MFIFKKILFNLFRTLHFHHFQYFVKFVGKPFGGLTYLHFKCPLERFEEQNFYWRKDKDFSVSRIERKFLGTLLNNLRGIAEFVRYISVRTFWWEIFFSKNIYFFAILEHWVKSFGPLVAIFWRGCQNCFLVVHCNVLR